MELVPGETLKGSLLLPDALRLARASTTLFQSFPQ
jgi:hypothetical protein